MALNYFTARGETLVLDDALRRQVRGSFVECDEGLTHYELAGPQDGELVMMVGGLTIPLFYWDAVVADLYDRGLRTLTFSAYGRGYSDRVVGKYDEQMFVRQASDLVDRLNVEPKHTVGSSMGALIAMAFARQRQTPLSTLMIIGPAGLDNATPRAAALLNVPGLGAAIGARFGPAMLEKHLGHNLSDPELTAALSKMIRTAYSVEGSMYALCATVANFPLSGRQSLYRDIGASPIPTLLVWGNEDQVTPAAHLPEAEELLKPARVELVSECGHMVPYQMPALTAAFIAEFATAHRGVDN